MEGSSVCEKGNQNHSHFQSMKWDRFIFSNATICLTWSSKYWNCRLMIDPKGAEISQVFSVYGG